MCRISYFPPAGELGNQGVGDLNSLLPTFRKLINAGYKLHIGKPNSSPSCLDERTLKFLLEFTQSK